jgi:hypothetical protein
MLNTELQEMLQELKIVTICINGTTEQMHKCTEVNRKFMKLYNERQEYLHDQRELNDKINSIINQKNK